MSREQMTGTDIEGTAGLRHCDECGRYFVRYHYCDALDPNVERTAEDRERLRELDRRDGDTYASDRVLFLHGRPDTAYHIPKFETDTPKCGSAAWGDRVFDSATRGEMWDSNHYPCRHCHPFF